MEHPLKIWWREKSGLHDAVLHATPEGRSCIDTWNAAIRAASVCVVADGNPSVAKEKIEALFYFGATP